MSIVRLSANLSGEVVDALKEVATRQGITITEALRRAISHQKFFTDAVRGGDKVLLRKPDGTYREILFI